MPDFAQFGNEKLVPLAVAGNEQALEELELRNNYLELDESGNPTGKLCKDVPGTAVMPFTFRDRPIERNDVVQVTNGQITAVTPA